MGPAYYVLAILGCGEGDAACRQVGVAEARYESLEACNAATAAAVERHVDLAFPVVAAQCRRADDELAGKVNARDVELPAPEAAEGRRQPVRRATYEVGRKSLL